jgi:hypothetical protein
MKRSRRQVFSELAMLSLVLCVATIALWTRSYMSPDDFQLSDKTTLKFMDGQIIVLVWNHTAVFVPGRDNLSDYRKNRSNGWEGLGFEYLFYNNPWENNGRSVFSVPFWSIMGISLIMPCFSIIAFTSGRRKARNAARGICLTCGYDLCATPDRCPECGTIPPKREIITN